MSQAERHSRYAEAIELHHEELRAHCMRILRSPHDAEDALQEALLRGWRSIHRFEGRGPLRAWLYRIATNASLDQIEAAARAGRRRRPRRAGRAGGPPRTPSVDRQADASGRPAAAPPAGGLRAPRGVRAVRAGDRGAPRRDGSLGQQQPAAGPSCPPATTGRIPQGGLVRGAAGPRLPSRRARRRAEAGSARASRGSTSFACRAAASRRGRAPSGRWWRPGRSR